MARVQHIYGKDSSANGKIPALIARLQHLWQRLQPSMARLQDIMANGNGKSPALISRLQPLMARLTGWQGACTLQTQQGGIHGNPASGNHPCMQLPPVTVALKSVQWKKYLPYPTLTKTHESRGREGWEQESATIHRKISYK